ncbi:MAG: hypothetical protein KDA89_06135 [Planctomycetaceae bacterium]|nr:hypothetical protein [Planctomycetaceae bacterium]
MDEVLTLPKRKTLPLGRRNVSRHNVISIEEAESATPEHRDRGAAVLPEDSEGPVSYVDLMFRWSIDSFERHFDRLHGFAS